MARDHIPSLGAIAIPKGVVRIVEHGWWSAWRVCSESGPYAYFRARLDESGQGFERLTFGETNWYGQPLPALYHAQAELFGESGRAPSVNAVQRYLAGAWTMGGGEQRVVLPASLLPMGRWFFDMTWPPDSLLHAPHTRDLRTWELVMEPDARDPVIVRLHAQVRA